MPIAGFRPPSAAAHLRSDSNLSGESLGYEEIVHPVQPRAKTSMLPPVMVSDSWITLC